MRKKGDGFWFIATTLLTITLVLSFKQPFEKQVIYLYTGQSVAHHYSERERLNHQGDVVNHGTVRGSIHGNPKRRKTLILKPQRTRKLKDRDLLRRKSHLQLYNWPWNKYTMEVCKLKEVLWLEVWWYGIPKLPK